MCQVRVQGVVPGSGVKGVLRFRTSRGFGVHGRGVLGYPFWGQGGLGMKGVCSRVLEDLGLVGGFRVGCKTRMVYSLNLDKP